MGNVFDQFDQAPASAPPAGNVFDQFDAPVPARSGRGDRATTTVPNPYRQDEGAAASFSDRFGDGPMASKTDISSGLGEGLRRVADEMLVGKPNAQNIAAAGTLSAINSAGLNLPRALGSALQSAPFIGNGRGYSENYEAAKEREEAYARQAPYAAGLGTATGIVGGALALPSVQAAKGAGILARMGANAKTGAAYGALGELIDNQDVGKAAGAGLLGGAVGGALTYPAEKAAALVGRGVSAIAASPYFAKGATVQNASGELTTTAKAVLKQAGISADDLTPELQQQIVAAFSRKGESEAVAREALGGEFGLSLSRGQATADPRALAYEQAALAGDRGPKAQAVAQSFRDQQQADIATASRGIADRLSGGVRAENPTQAAEAIADQARAYRTQATSEADRLQALTDDALARLRGPSPLDPLDAASVVRDGLRDRAAQSRAAYKSAYDELGQLPGEFHPNAFDNLGTIIGKEIGAEFPIDRVLHPSASKALEMLNDIPGALGLPEGVGPTARQVENFRKRFSMLSNSATTPADREGVRLVRDRFDVIRRELAEIGRFGPRSEPVGGVGGIADDFPGIPAGGAPGASEAIPASTQAAGGRQRGPESLLQWAERVGLPYDAETRALDLHRRPAAGYGTLARKSAPEWDDLRVMAMEAGFRPPDEAGAASAASAKDWILNGIQNDLVHGRKTFRLGEEGQAATTGRNAGRIADENADFAAQVDWQARRNDLDMERYGYTARDLDPAARREAAEAMVRGEADDAADAYDRAVMRRSADVGEGVAPPRSPGDDVPFPELGEGFTPSPAGSAFPAATPEGTAYAQREGIARGMFSTHRGQFGAQGKGDDVGRTIETVLDREREPVEVARQLFGPNAGKNTRIADRISAVVPKESPEWAAYQSGYISTIINGKDMTSRAIDARIGDALTGDRRGLTYRLLSGEHIAAMKQFRAAVQRSEGAKQAVPPWIETLGRSDFDPNRITSDLFGAGVPGSRPGSAAYASALKTFVGPESPAWQGIKGAAFRLLVETPDGAAQLAPRVMVQRMDEFTSGKGSGLAKQLYSAQELAEIKRFANALRGMTDASGNLKPNNGGPSLQRVASHALDALAASLGYAAGGLPGAAAAYTGKFGSKLLLNGLQGRAARKAFEGGAPRVVPDGPVLDLRPIGVGSGLSAEYGL